MRKTVSSLADKDQALHEMICSNQFGTFFGISQKFLDQVWGRLTDPTGNSAVYISMEIAADRDVYHPVKSRLNELAITGSTDPVLDKFSDNFLNGPEKIPNYGGGLGVLAGDTLKSFADCRIPVAAVSLLYRRGYFSQLIDSKIGQISWSRDWSPEDTPGIYPLHRPGEPGIPLEIEVPFYDADDRQVMAFARIWMKLEINSRLDYCVPEILLDYSCPNSPQWIRDAAQNLYDSSSEKIKITQRRMLGAGVTPTLTALGITSKTFHLNEQHGVAVTLTQIVSRLMKKYGQDYHLKASDDDIIEAAREVGESIVYTIHTPVKAGHDRFHRDLYRSIGHFFCQRILNLLARDSDSPHDYNFTNLAMQINRSTNSVSRLHREVTRKQFPRYAEKITAITNGVHHLTWISEAKAEFYDSFEELSNWRQEPTVFANAAALIDNKRFRTFLQRAWQQDNLRLINYVNDMLIRHRSQMHETWIDPPNFLSHIQGEGTALTPGTFTIGFARRFSTYKRADLIFEDLDKLLVPVLKNRWPVNFIFAGKAHPSDEPGKALIKMILNCQEELFVKSEGLARLVFIPGYDMGIAKMMISGVHAWLNSPKRPLEASGTSGMKSALNAIPNISTMDGWWDEGYQDGLNGWKFGYEESVGEHSFSEERAHMLYAEDSNSFYSIFPRIMETFYNPELFPRYLEKCINNIIHNCPRFNTHRMVAEYTDRYRLDLPGPVQRKMVKFIEVYDSNRD